MGRGKLRVYLGAAPASARPTPCSARATAGPSAAPTSSSASSRPTVAGTPPTMLGRPGDRAATRDLLPRTPRSPRWTSTRCSPAAPRWRSSTSWRTRTCPGSRNEKRWQDVEELLDAGIDVISTVNIQHLESLNDVVEKITGVPQRETGARRRGPRGRPGRAGRHGPGGAAAADGARQRLRGGEGRRRAGQLLPRREPDRAARAGPALDRGQGRRGAAGLPRRARHRGHLGGPRAGRRRASPAARRARR